MASASALPQVVENNKERLRALSVKISKHQSVCVSVCLFACVCVCVGGCVCVSMCACTCFSLSLCMCVYMHMCICMCLGEFMRACMCSRACITDSGRIMSPSLAQASWRLIYRLSPKP